MAWTGEALRKALPFLEKIEGDVHFDTYSVKGEDYLRFQAGTQEKVASLKGAFPPTVWKRIWNEVLDWWEYSTILNTDLGELKVGIYAVTEAPAQCKAIIERKLVSKSVPTEWKEEEVEEDVIVGWDCGKEEAE